MRTQGISVARLTARPSEGLIAELPEIAYRAELDLAVL
jgi:hypothetical protein